MLPPVQTFHAWESKVKISISIFLFQFPVFLLRFAWLWKAVPIFKFPYSFRSSSDTVTLYRKFLKISPKINGPIEYTRKKGYGGLFLSKTELERGAFPFYEKIWENQTSKPIFFTKTHRQLKETY